MRHERTACPGGSPSVRSRAYDSPPSTSDSAICRGCTVTRRSIAAARRSLPGRRPVPWCMRDLIVTENIPLDGVIDAAGGWFGPAGTDDGGEFDPIAPGA